ncbi:TetR/AcrR family transcriptional regulator [Roseateles sp.]|uniref:TetR/AcrR family transcriptional regulator n=1 Tax=Roseateles sp. TaxID=1971397 RepID=UPI00326790BB
MPANKTPKLASDPDAPASPPLRRVATGRASQREAQPDRRTNILLAAEKLFALRGFHAVSIRDIAAEAGVPLALVGYYYGAKHELYHAIFQSWSSAIEGRLEALRAAVAEPDVGLRLARILDSFASPLIALHQHPEGQYYAQMAARDLAAPTPEAERANLEFFDPLANAFIDALMTTAPGVSRGQVAWCYQFMLGALLHFLADKRVERLSRGENRAADPNAKATLLAFLSHGFQAVTGAPSGAPRVARASPGKQPAGSPKTSKTSKKPTKSTKSTKSN